MNILRFFHWLGLGKSKAALHVVSFVGLLAVSTAVEALKFDMRGEENLPIEAQEALTWVAEQYEKSVTGDSVLIVSITWDLTGKMGSTLASCGSTGYKQIERYELRRLREDFRESEYGQFYIPITLWQQLYPDDSETVQGKVFGGVHITCTIDGTQNWYYGQGPNQINGQPDFRATLLHEMAHALGFDTGIDENGRFMGSADRFDGTPTTFDLYIAGDQDPFLFYFGLWTPLRLFTPGARQTIINGGAVYWQGEYTRDVLRPLHETYTAIEASGEIKMYSPTRWESGSSLTHWSRGLVEKFLMSPASGISPNTIPSPFRSPALEIAVLKDIGWDVGSVVVLPTDAHFPTGGLFKTLSGGSTTITVWNSTRDTLVLADLSLQGPDASEFSISAPEILPEEIAPGQSLMLTVDFVPSSEGIKQAYVSLKDAADPSDVRTVELYGWHVEDDADNDGISDFNESRDLDSSLPGIQNPFNPNNLDSIGNDGLDGFDYVVDGLNDWDMDGISNREEFLLNLSPLQPDPVREVYVHNRGEFPISVLEAVIIGEDAGEFSILYGGQPSIVAPGRAYRMLVRFAPLSVGPKNAQVQVKYEVDEIESLTYLPLNGTGVE